MQRIDDGLVEIDRKICELGPGDNLHIIHGIGTGKLRAGVLEYLQQNDRVGGAIIGAAAQVGGLDVTQNSLVCSKHMLFFRFSGFMKMKTLMEVVQ